MILVFYKKRYSLYLQETISSFLKNGQGVANLVEQLDSKSFLAVLAQMIRCILYPGAKLYSTAGGKSQSAGILSEKVEEICTKIPAFAREIDRGKGKTSKTKDYCKYVFKNGSRVDNIVASERARGMRRQGGIFEECVSIDKDILQQVLIPIANISRQCLDGTIQQSEMVNQSEIYITTAGYKSDYGYEKLIQLLVEMIVNPEEAFIMGGTYRIPVLTGQYPPNLIENLKRDETFNEATFGREYCSTWSGGGEDSFFNGEHFDRNRRKKRPEYKARAKGKGQRFFYVVCADIARSPRGCQTAVMVFKCFPQDQGPMIKELVNIITWTGEHFEEQAIELKKLYYQYKAKRLIIDANGLGYGLVDWMVKPQVDDELGINYPDFGVYNDKDFSGEYAKFRTARTEDDALYLIKANKNELDSKAYVYVQSDMASGKIKFLVDERTARAKLMLTRVGQQMTPEKRKEFLLPYVLTDVLKAELMNLHEESHQGANIKLKRITKAIGMDKVSALAYGIYYIKEVEEKGKKKKRFNASEWRFYN